MGMSIVKRKLVMMVVMLVLCSVLTSCDNRTKEDKEIPNINVASSDMDKSLQDESMIKKYTAYTKLNLLVTGKLESCLRFYFGKFGATEEFKVDSRTSLSNGIFLELSKKDMTGVEEYASKEPSIAGVDSSVKEMYPKLKELVQSLEEADLYYKMKSYVDDNMAKGKELHKKIYSQSLEVKPLAAKFTSELAADFSKKSKAELNNLEKKDFKVRYYSLRSVMSAMELEDEIVRQGISSKNLKDLDMEKFKEKYNLLVEHTNKFLEISKDLEQLKKEKINESIAYVSDFRISVMNTKTAATDMIIRAEAEKNAKNGTAKDISREEKEVGTPENYSKKIKESIIHYLTNLSK